MYPIKGKTGAT